MQEPQQHPSRAIKNKIARNRANLIASDRYNKLLSPRALIEAPFTSDEIKLLLFLQVLLRQVLLQQEPQ